MAGNNGKTAAAIDIEACVKALKEGFGRYRDYDHCEKFIDAMTRHADAYVPAIAPGFGSVQALKDRVLEYVLCVCTGLEEAEGETWRILGPQPAYTAEEIAKKLTKE